MSGYVDTQSISSNHLKILKYIEKYITRDIDSISISEFSNLIREHKLQNGNKLAYGSIKNLFYTMAKHRKTDWNLKEMKLAKNKFWSKINPNDNLYTEEEEKVIINMINFYVNHFISNYKYKNNKILDNVSFAVILTVATNLRISEIKQLRKYHLRQIIDNKIINIKTKKKLSGIYILSHKWLIETILKNVEDKYDDALLIQVSTATINKHIKLKLQDTSIKCGIQGIRKITTTQLIKDGDIKLAQTFNRHSSAETTAKYYNNKTYITPTINRVISNKYSLINFYNFFEFNIKSSNSIFKSDLIFHFITQIITGCLLIRVYNSFSDVKSNMFLNFICKNN
ncbi:VLF-1a [Macrobrachium rosenbergii nudivirus]|nr:VLF-1a [Macrobrachium rosenbergii nudivirus]